MAGRIQRHLPPLPSVSDIVRLYRLRARKQLSQNFLLDMNIANKIVRKAGDLQGAYVCEVGPGPGGITRSILNAGVQQLSIIEKDTRFIPSLQLLADAADNKLRIFHGDVLQFDMSDLFPKHLTKQWDEESPNIHIIGNLPFSVSTPLIIQYLRDIAEHSGAWSYGRTRLTLTFQKEVAERMAAPISTDQRCRLSVMCQNWCSVQHRFTIPGRSFVPPPKVDVGVVTLVPLREPKIKLPFTLIEKVVRHIFQFRRKQCKRGIQTLFPSDRPELTTQLLLRADVEPETRSFQLTLPDFERLCHAYEEICDRNPGLIDFYFRSEETMKQWHQDKVPLEI